MDKRSFLVVDNSEIASTTLAKMLESLGYTGVEQVQSAGDAWKRLKMFSYGGIIAEMEMPDMSGLALLQFVRSDDRLYDLPFFIAHVAFTKTKVLMAGKEGVSGLLVKPYDLNHVSEKLKTMVDVSESKVIKEARHTVEEGLALLENNEYDKALSVFEKLVNEGECAEYYYNIGYIKTAQEKYGEALVAFKKATELDRLFAKAYEAMGQIFHKLGKPEDAERFLQKAADIHLSRENTTDAEEILSQILKIRPDTINVYNSLGVLHRKKGNLKEALTSYEKALRIHPDQPHIYYNMGRLWLELKDAAKAKVQFEKALRLNPKFDDAREVLEAIRLGIIE